MGCTGRARSAGCTWAGGSAGAPRPRPRLGRSPAPAPAAAPARACGTAPRSGPGGARRCGGGGRGCLGGIPRARSRPAAQHATAARSSGFAMRWWGRQQTVSACACSGCTCAGPLGSLAQCVPPPRGCPAARAPAVHGRCRAGTAVAARTTGGLSREAPLPARSPPGPAQTRATCLPHPASAPRSGAPAGGAGAAPSAASRRWARSLAPRWPRCGRTSGSCRAGPAPACAWVGAGSQGRASSSSWLPAASRSGRQAGRR